METYIALLRGINVSGQKKIIMADLRSHLEELNFKNIQTYIQSGNIVFQFKKIDPNKLEATISKLILKVYGFDVPCIIRTKEDLENLLASNPYAQWKEVIEKGFYFVLLKSPPLKENLSRLESIDFKDEYFEVHTHHIYLYVPKGAGQAKLSNNYFEKKLNLTASTRNLRTIQKLIDMAAG